MARKKSFAETVERFLIECGLCSFRSTVADTAEDATELGLNHLATAHPKLDAELGLAELRIWTFAQPLRLVDLAELAEPEPAEPERPHHELPHVAEPKQPTEPAQPKPQPPKKRKHTR